MHICIRHAIKLFSPACVRGEKQFILFSGKVLCKDKEAQMGDSQEYRVANLYELIELFYEVYFALGGHDGLGSA